MPETTRPEIKSKKWVKPRYVPKRKVCVFCKDKVTVIDYKDAEKLKNFISDRSKIDPRRKTGTCAKHQRLLATAIKRARHLALLPFVPVYGRGSEFRGRSFEGRPRATEKPPQPVTPPVEPTQAAPPAEAAQAEPEAPTKAS
jgi:small subunit ribosomal protein S18